MKLAQFQCPSCDTVATMDEFSLVHRTCQERGFYIECDNCETEMNCLELDDVTDEEGYRYPGENVDEVEAGLVDRLTS